MIMVGLFNIGLGPGRMSYHPEDLTHLRAAYWLGGVVNDIVVLISDRKHVLFIILLNVALDCNGRRGTLSDVFVMLYFTSRISWL